MGNNCFNGVMANDLQLSSHEMNSKNIDLTIEKNKNSLNDISDLEKKYSLKKKLSEKNELSDNKNKNNIDTQILIRKNVKNNAIKALKNEELKEDYEKSVLTIVKEHNRNNEDKDLINNCLIKHFFMKDLDKEARNEIIQEMSLYSLNQNTYIYINKEE